MNDLTILEDVNAVQVFTSDGLDELLNKIAEEVSDIVPDTSTAKGRAEIASMAHKVAKSKTTLDAMGKELVADWKAKSKAVDAERKKARDYLDNLKAEVRKPLTDWEQAEKERVELHEYNIGAIAHSAELSNQWMDLSLEQVNEFLYEVESVKIEDFEEYATDAAKAKDTAITQIKEAIAKREAYDKERAELDKLRAESEARAKADEEERLRKEGEERARIEAESKAQAEAMKVEADAAKAEQARIDAVKEKDDAELRAKQAEENVKIEVEKAAQAERDRIEQERIDEELAAKKREANKAHKKKINNAIVDALVAIGVSQTAGKKAVIAIAKGEVPHTRISY